MQTPQRLPVPAVLALVLFVIAACGDSGDTRAPVDQPTAAEDALSVGIVVPDDDIFLTGRLFGDEHDSLVILSHMRPNDQTAWTAFARTLAENGYAALTFDFRGYGVSNGDQDYNKLDDDLAAAISYMRARGGKSRIFLVGASMGATTSLVVAAEEDVDGVVSISAPSEFQGQNALEAISRISAPVFLVAAEDDAAAMVSMNELLEAGGPAVTSQTYPGGEHGTALVEGTQAGDVQERVLEFLAQHSAAD